MDWRYESSKDYYNVSYRYITKIGISRKEKHIAAMATIRLAL